jgi:hypothetical protein
VAEDFSGELGDTSEKLTAAAAAYLQTGACPPASALRVSPLRVEPGDRRGMTP